MKYLFSLQFAFQRCTGSVSITTPQHDYNNRNFATKRFRTAEGCAAIPNAMSFTVHLEVHESISFDAHAFIRHSLKQTGPTHAILCSSPNERDTHRRPVQKQKLYEFGQRQISDFLVYFERQNSTGNLFPWPVTHTLPFNFHDVDIEITFVRVSINVR